MDKYVCYSNDVLYIIFKVKWEKNSLTYGFRNFPSNDLSKAEVRREIRKAFKLWSDVTPLRFTEISTTEGPGQADIRIGFYKRAHLGESSRLAFDGNGGGCGVLAHAFFPLHPEIVERAGDIHFDDEEHWIITGNTG